MLSYFLPLASYFLFQLRVKCLAMQHSTSQKFIPACLPTGIGSLPFTRPEEAVNFVGEFYSEIPFWPQLPLRNEKEKMLVQFLGELPHLEMKGGLPQFTLSGDNPKLLTSLEEHQSTEWGAQKASAWNQALDFFEKKKHPKGSCFKTQIIGPITLALNAKDREGKNLFAFPKLANWFAEFLKEKALWQIRKIKEHGWTPILFLDEPSLSTLDPLWIRNQRKYLLELLRSASSAFSENGALAGVHCCGNTDWSVVFESGMDIVSFDALENMNYFLQSHEALRNHFQKGRSVAWGLISSQYLGYDLDCSALVGSFLKKLEKIVFPHLSQEHILLHSLVTTTCGTPGLSREENRKAHGWVREVSNLLRKEVLHIE